MTRHLLILIAIAIVALPCAVSLAQGGNTTEMRRLELERTDDLIERAESAIRSSDNPGGMDLLTQAKNLQARAWEHFRGGDLGVARTLTFQARDLTKKAVNQSRQNEQTESIVLAHLERAGEQLDRARDILMQLDDRNLSAIYETARDNLKRAWEFYNKKQYRPAMKLTDQVDWAAQKIFNSKDNSRDNAAWELRHEAVVAAVEQARDILSSCGSRKGQLFLQHAEKALQSAEEMHAKGRLASAMEALQRAKDMAAKAVRECKGGQLLQARYEQLLNKANQLKERSLSFSGQKRDLIDKLLVQAYEQLSLAQGYIQSGESDRALAALQAASLALRQVDTYISQGS